MPIWWGFLTPAHSTRYHPSRCWVHGFRNPYLTVRRPRRADGISRYQCSSAVVERPHHEASARHRCSAHPQHLRHRRHRDMVGDWPPAAVELIRNKLGADTLAIPGPSVDPERRWTSLSRWVKAPPNQEFVTQDTVQQTRQSLHVKGAHYGGLEFSSRGARRRH